MKTVFEMVAAQPKSSTLGQCDFCQLWFEHEDLVSIEDYSLCEDCKIKFNDEKEQVRIQNQLQRAMDELPTDQLLALRWILSIGYQQIEDKSNCENIHQWNDRISSAIAAKDIDSRKGRRHSGLNVPMAGISSSHTHQKHSS